MIGTLFDEGPVRVRALLASVRSLFGGCKEVHASPVSPLREYVCVIERSVLLYQA